MTLALASCDGVTELTGFELQQPTHEYEIDTWGTNSEVYEFTPLSNPNKTCVMLMLDSGVAVGFDCFDKPNRGNK